MNGESRESFTLLHLSYKLAIHGLGLNYRRVTLTERSATMRLRGHRTDRAQRECMEHIQACDYY